jgi:hypothetical protein
MSSVLHDTKVAGNTEQGHVRRHICVAVRKFTDTPLQFKVERGAKEEKQ